MNNNSSSIDFWKTAICRQEEIVLLEKILSRNKICIINGMAGIGKTYFARLYAHLHEDAAYFVNYNFHFRDLENCVKEPSFFDNIKSNSILIIDDITDDINFFISSAFFASLKKLNPKNIILITRQDILQNKVPVLNLRPFTLAQTYELIKKITDNKFVDTEIDQIARISNGNPVMIQVICSLLNSNSNIDEIWEQLSLEQNKRLIYPFTQRGGAVFLVLMIRKYKLMQRY